MADFMNFPVYDELDVNKNRKLKGFLGKTERVLFSGIVTKINKKRTPQQRILVITNEYLYNIWPYNTAVTSVAHLLASKITLRRKVAVAKINAITISSYPLSNQFVLHVESEYDYRYDGAARREQIIQSICAAHFCKMNSNVSLYIKNTQDLKEYQTTDDDLKLSVDKRPKIGQIVLTPELLKKGIDYIVKNKSELIEGLFSKHKDDLEQEKQLAEEKLIEEYNEMPNCSVELGGSFDKEQPISSIFDIPLTQSGILTNCTVATREDLGQVKS